MSQVSMCLLIMSCIFLTDCLSTNTSTSPMIDTIRATIPIARLSPTKK